MLVWVPAPLCELPRIAKWAVPRIILCMVSLYLRLHEKAVGANIMQVMVVFKGSKFAYSKTK